MPWKSMKCELGVEIFLQVGIIYTRKNSRRIDTHSWISRVERKGRRVVVVHRSST
jgi:hypothetical protein